MEKQKNSRKKAEKKKPLEEIQSLHSPGSDDMTQEATEKTQQVAEPETTLDVSVEKDADNDLETWARLDDEVADRASDDEDVKEQPSNAGDEDDFAQFIA